MNSKQNNNLSKQIKDQTSTYTHKKSSTSNSTRKDRDATIPTKEKSPDDLEIID